MKHMHEVVLPARPEMKLLHITCDLCGAKTKDGDVWPLPEGEPSLSGEYHTRRALIELEEAAGFGQDGGESESVTVDVCPECFKGKLLPWLESMGVKPTRANCDW